MAEKDPQRVPDDKIAKQLRECMAKVDRDMRRSITGRTNRNRRKTTIYLDQRDRDAIQTIQRRTGRKTNADAIRYALQAAAQEPPDTTAIGGRILRWAKSLKFTSPRENGELRQLAAELYQIVSRKA